MTFKNTERIIVPSKDQSDYYNEWTVVTPEYPDLTGPERIITGKGGEIYYTGNHYSDFTKLD